MYLFDSRFSKRQNTCLLSLHAMKNTGMWEHSVVRRTRTIRPFVFVHLLERWRYVCAVGKNRKRKKHTILTAQDPITAPFINPEEEPMHIGRNTSKNTQY